MLLLVGVRVVSGRLCCCQLMPKLINFPLQAETLLCSRRCGFCGLTLFRFSFQLGVGNLDGATSRGPTTSPTLCIVPVSKG